MFISSKSEDYTKAREIHKYLVEKNMIVVCSNHKFIQTGWVYYEWNTFSVEILSGRKLGSNILTVINESLSTDELPIGLRA